MTTPIDTTRLRARAEAVRDAGVKSTYAHHVVKRLVDAGHSDLTSARKDAREAAETLRGAQKRLYRDAPPDGIILALLDEVERLRALVAHPNIVSVVDTVQHLANEVYLRGETEYAEILDTAADRLLVASGNHNTIPNADDEPEEGGDHG